MAMEKFTVSMYDTDVDLFELRRTELGMSKSAFIRLLLAEHENKVPSFIKDKELINAISELNTSVKELIISDKVDEIEVLHLIEQIKVSNEMFRKIVSGR